jgi:hypothetical protein
MCRCGGEADVSRARTAAVALGRISHGWRGRVAMRSVEQQSGSSRRRLQCCSASWCCCEGVVPRSCLVYFRTAFLNITPAQLKHTPGLALGRACQREHITISRTKGVAARPFLRLSSSQTPKRALWIAVSLVFVGHDKSTAVISCVPEDRHGKKLELKQDASHFRRPTGHSSLDLCPVVDRFALLRTPAIDVLSRHRRVKG